MKSSIAIINAYPKFDAVFEPVAGELGMSVRRYAGIKPMADELNAKALPMDELALIMVTGTSGENDADQYRRNMSLLSQLAKHSKLKAVPVLFLGYKGNAALGDACAANGAGYLPLPVRKSELMGVIRNLLSSAGEEPAPQPVPAANAHVKQSSPAESERRLATVMFADISGFTAMSEKMDPEEVTGVMNGVFNAMEDIIHAHGGTIDKFIGDCVMVLFGVPKALENAPLMAVNTAIEMRNALYGFNREKKLSIPLDIHIGMNTGSVVAGSVGGKSRKDYTVMGDAVNLASRIESASVKGQILVGPETYRATQGEIEYRALEPVSLKGKAEPVPVYEVLSVKEKTQRQRPGLDRHAKSGPERMVYSELVGRDREMDLLRLLLMKVIIGEGGIVSIIGEAGIGKSRLMAELKGDPAMVRVTHLEGQAISMGRSLSYHPIIDMLKNHLGVREDDDDGSAFGKLEAFIRDLYREQPDAVVEVAAFIATMMGMRLSGKHADTMKNVTGEALEKFVSRYLGDILTAMAANRPLVVRVEDLHWADASSIDLLLNLFRLAEKHRVLFVLAFRPHYIETGDRIAGALCEAYGKTEGRGAGIYNEITVQPLGSGECAQLIDNLLDIKGLPASLKEQIASRAGGNPFFIEEVVRSLIDEGAVARQGDVFTVTEKINAVTVPMTINEVLMARIDRLEEDTRNLVKTASVIGRYFFYKIIAQVASDIPDIDHRLSHLEDIQLIRERKRMDELEYLFKHALAQEAAYDSLLLQKRKDLHVSVARAIEAVFAERLHEFYGMLAYHYGKGEDYSRAEEYLLKAGDEALKSSGSREALGYFQEGLGLYKKMHGERADPGIIMQLEKKIVTALFYRGRFSEAMNYVTQVMAQYGLAIPRRKIMYLYKVFTGSLLFLLAIYFPKIKWHRTYTLHDKELMDLILIYLSCSIMLQGSKTLMEALVFMKDYADYEDNRDINRLDFMSGVALLTGFMGFLRFARKSLGFYRMRLDNERKDVILYFDASEALYDFFSGDWRLEYDAVRVANSVKKVMPWFFCNYILYSCFRMICKGEFKPAAGAIAKLEETGELLDSDLARDYYLTLGVRIALKERRLDEGLKQAAEAIAFRDEHGQQDLNLNLLALKASMLLLLNDLDGAGAALSEAAVIASRMSFKLPPRMSTYYLSCFLFNVAKLEEGLRVKDKQAIGRYGRLSLRSGKLALRNSKKIIQDRTEICQFFGVYFWLRGKPKKALTLWKKCVDLGEKLGARPDLARAYYEIWKRTHGLAPETIRKVIGLTPEECLGKAEALFREMDLTWDLAQLEKNRYK